AVYAHHPDHPGVLHYLIHAYDDPVHAEKGLPAARAYAQAAAAVPHALHMPSHIFTRLGYWDESARTNLRGWEVSEADVKRVRASPGRTGIFTTWPTSNMPTCSWGVFAMRNTVWTSWQPNTKLCPTSKPRPIRRN